MCVKPQCKAKAVMDSGSGSGEPNLFGIFWKKNVLSIVLYVGIVRTFAFSFKFRANFLILEVLIPKRFFLNIILKKKEKNHLRINMFYA